MRIVTATRYVTPLREGGSLPAIIEADDDGMYVLKFRGAGQGPKALIAELVAGELARAAGLPVPEIVLVSLDPEMARTEPDPEIQELIRASAGLNLALDYLPGSVTFDPVVEKLDHHFASMVVWFDAFVTNVDRTPKNTNMLMWHRKPYLIDHGAALYFHHAWSTFLERSADPFSMIKNHVLLHVADSLQNADEEMKGRISGETIDSVVSLIPETWLLGSTVSEGEQHRSVYREYLHSRLNSSRMFVEEAIRARAV